MRLLSGEEVKAAVRSLAVPLAETHFRGQDSWDEPLVSRDRGFSHGALVGCEDGLVRVRISVVVDLISDVRVVGDGRQLGVGAGVAQQLLLFGGVGVSLGDEVINAEVAVVAIRTSKLEQ